MVCWELILLFKCDVYLGHWQLSGLVFHYTQKVYSGSLLMNTDKLYCTGSLLILPSRHDDGEYHSTLCKGIDLVWGRGQILDLQKSS